MLLENLIAGQADIIVDLFTRDGKLGTFTVLCEPFHY